MTVLNAKERDTFELFGERNRTEFLLWQKDHFPQLLSLMGGSEVDSSGGEMGGRFSEKSGEAQNHEREFHPDYKALKKAALTQFIIHRACLRKGNLSEETANQIVDQHAAEGRLMYFYKCEFCCSYHLTKKPVAPKNKLAII